MSAFFAFLRFLRCSSVFDSVPSYLEEEWLGEEYSEWFDPLCAEFFPQVTPVARDPIFDSASTGLEAEAMMRR